MRVKHENHGERAVLSCFTFYVSLVAYHCSDGMLLPTLSTILSLIALLCNCLPTRIAFLIARASDRPWQIRQYPATPSSGAPPDSRQSCLVCSFFITGPSCTSRSGSASWISETIV